ncbi:hypothetical protein [Stieleria mannarensis]|uniref:hypothetical protein n=1 Tax=Stieleria mannarensis TaxID=2755585 RepID=UPI0016009D9F|nr:hypothetical protein [Rhodopirellula sp. JC639]
MRSLLVLSFFVTTSSVFAQHQQVASRSVAMETKRNSSVAVEPKSSRGLEMGPKQNRSLADEQMQALVETELTDYEVWIAADASKHQYYTLYILTKDGWVEVPGDAKGEAERFYSESSVYDFLAAMQGYGIDFVEYEIEAHTPDTSWTYIGTFDERDHAEEILSLVLDGIALSGVQNADSYFGEVRAVTAVPRSLR